MPRSPAPFDPIAILPSTKHPPRPPELIIAEKESQWMFTDQELARTPSVEDGMAAAQERDIRSKGLHFIMQVGIMVKLPQLTLSTAAIFFNRFLMRYSLVAKPGAPKPLHHYQIAATALFLSTKTTETPRKLRELVTACCRVAQKNPALVVPEDSKDFWRWRDTLLYNEDVLLETLCFDVSVTPPHRALFDLLRRMAQEHNKPLRNAAWAFLNDACLTTLSLRFDARTVAAAAVYAAARFVGHDCRFADDDRGRPWWAVHALRLRDIRLACNAMADLYEADPEKMGAADADAAGMYAGLRTPLDGDEDDAKTRSKRPADDPPSASASSSTFDGPALMGTEREDLERRKRARAAAAAADSNGAAAENTGSKRARTSTSQSAPASVNASASANGDKDDAGSEEGELEG